MRCKAQIEGHSFDFFAIPAVAQTLKIHTKRYGPKARMSAISAPPVAIAFASSASPVLSPQIRSAIMPEPIDTGPPSKRLPRF